MGDPLSLIPETDFVKHKAGKFAPKLNDTERCAVLALAKSGIRRERIASAFDIDRRTVGHIVNPQSIRYKDVRNKYKAMGHKDFIETYITEEVAIKVANLPAEAAPVDVPKATSRRANRLAGSHTVQPEQCAYPHRIEIAHLTDGPAGEGWYYKDQDNKTNPDDWFHNGDDSRKTSQACFDALQENLFD